MDITTSWEILESSLSSIVFLGWPVIALGYPLFASIMAVSKDSKDQMRKLVMYWTLFSLFSLIEFAFTKIIEWIPYWSIARLVVICCLVLPQFEGSCLAYQGLARTVLLVKRLCTRETVSNVVENNINENVSEALETRILLEHESQKHINIQRDTKIIGQDGESSAATSNQHESLKCIDLQKDTKIIEQEGENSAATSKQVLNETCAITNVEVITPPKESVVDRRPETIPLEKTQQDEPSITSAQVLSGTFSITIEMTPPKASAEDRCPGTIPLEKTQQDELSISSAQVLNGTFSITKEMTPPKASAENRRPETTPLKKTLEEWTCDDVQHAQSGSVARDLTGTFAAAEFKDIMPPNETAESRCPETPLLKKAQLEWTTTSEITFNNHLQGRKHMSTLDADDKGSSPSATIKLKDGNVAEKLIKDSGSEGKLIANKTDHGECGKSHGDVQVVESKDKSGPAAPQQQAQHTQSEHGECSNGDVQVVESKKKCGPAAPQQQVQHKQSVKVTAAPDLKKTYAVSVVKGITQPKELAEDRRPETPLVKKAHQDKGPSPSATIKLKDGSVAEKLSKDGGSEGKLSSRKTGRRECSNSHRDIQVVESTEKNGPAASKQGRKHMSKLGAKNKGPSPSATVKLKDGNVAEKLIKDSGSEGKLIASKTERGERSNSHGDLHLVESKEKNCPVASHQYANGEVYETTPPKAQKEWRRDLYIVRGTSEDTLRAQLRGSKLESKFESLKTSKNGAFPKWCTVCDVKLESDDNVVSHFKGKKHISNTKLSQKNEET